MVVTATPFATLSIAARAPACQELRRSIQPDGQQTGQRCQSNKQNAYSFIDGARLLPTNVLTTAPGASGPTYDERNNNVV